MLFQFILFPEQDKPNQPKKPDEPDPRQATRHGFCISPVALISQYACLTRNHFSVNNPDERVRTRALQ